MTIGYCMKCHAKREMKGAAKTKIGKRNAYKGVCKKCGTKMFKFF